VLDHKYGLLLKDGENDKVLRDQDCYAPDRKLKMSRESRWKRITLQNRKNLGRILLHCRFYHYECHVVLHVFDTGLSAIRNQSPTI
jgi:hypothetical protein